MYSGQVKTNKCHNERAPSSVAGPECKLLISLAVAAKCISSASDVPF